MITSRSLDKTQFYNSNKLVKLALTLLVIIRLISCKDEFLLRIQSN